jgi:MFS family permease
MKRLSWVEIINLNWFWLGLNIRNNAVQAIFLPYLVNEFAAESSRNSALGFARAAGLIVAMLAQPAFGALSDRSTARYGRRRPFIIFGVLLDLVFLGLLALSKSYPMLIVSILLIQLSSNISHGPYQAIIPDMVTEEQRGLASAVKSIFELLPIVFLGFTIAALVGQGKFSLAVISTGGALIFFMLLTVLLIKELPNPHPVFEPIGPILFRVLGLLIGIGAGGIFGLLIGGVVGGLAAGLAWLAGWKAYAWPIWIGAGGVIAMLVAIVGGVNVGIRATLGKEPVEPAFIWWVVNRLSFLAALTSIQSFAPYFLASAFEVDIETAIAIYGKLITVVGAFILISALPSGWLSDRIGPKRLVAFSAALGASATGLLLTTVWTPTLPIIYLAGAGLGIAGGLFVVANWSLGTRLAPAAQAGRYLGIANLAGAGSGIIGAGLGGVIADTLNRFSAGSGYFVIFCGFGILFLLSIASLRGIRRS